MKPIEEFSYSLETAMKFAEALGYAVDRIQVSGRRVALTIPTTPPVHAGMTVEELTKVNLSCAFSLASTLLQLDPMLTDYDRAQVASILVIGAVGSGQGSSATVA